MAVKLPRLCVSHTVRGTATFRIDTSAPYTTGALTAQRYWTDPVYGSALVASGSPCLLGAMAALLDVSATVTTAGKSYSTTSSPAYRATFTAAAGSFAFIPAHAGTTAEGLRVLRRLGCDLAGNSASVSSGNDRTWPYALAVWDPDRGESGDTDEQWDAYGNVIRTVGGVVYTNDLGAPLPRRMLTFNGLSGSYARDRIADGATRYGFEAIVWPYLALGELVRYYADRTATTTYITSAVSSTDTTVAVADRTSISANDFVCADGEWMKVTASGSGAGNLTVERSNPVAHSQYAPLAKDFVATYALAEDAGDVSRRGFTPSRRALNQDRWDFDVGLIRAVP